MTMENDSKKIEIGRKAKANMAPSSVFPVIYGQVVVGPPGSGKTTYCNGMQQFCSLLHRNAQVLNLDPANDDYDQYDTIFDISRDLVHLQEVMLSLDLGPNGGLLYCMEYLANHVDTVVTILEERFHGMDTTTTPYLILDFPGQVELFTHGTCISSFLQELSKRLNLRLCGVHLMDATMCWEATKYLSAALVSTTTMLRLELPMIHVLSKIDLISKQELPFSLDYFTECHDLNRLLPHLLESSMNTTSTTDNDDDCHWYEDIEYQQARQKMRQSKFHRNHERLHKLLAEVVEDFGLLSYIPLDISDAASVGHVLSRIDKCNGYVFTATSSSTESAEELFQCAFPSSEATSSQVIADIQERLTWSPSS